MSFNLTSSSDKDANSGNNWRRPLTVVHLLGFVFFASLVCNEKGTPERLRILRKLVEVQIP